MKKRTVMFLCVFLCFFCFPFNSHASLLRMKKPTLYKIFEPLFKALGYRELKVHVYDEATLGPIENAIVMFGENNEEPFEKNWTTTDQNGNASFDSFLLPQGPITITAAHKDYSRYSIFQSEAVTFQIPLTPLKEEDSKTQLSGSFTLWPEMEDHDGTVHIGAAFPFIDIISLINFSSEKLLAPPQKAFIYKEVKVPGNFVLPTQEENYWGFIPVYISKPTYQMPFKTGSGQNLIALAGDAPFSKVANGVINKESYAKLLNRISINQFGLIQNIKIPETSLSLDIPLTYTLKPRFNISIYNSPSNMDIIYISSAFFKDELRIFPFDFKMSSRSDKNKSAILKSLSAPNLLPPLQEMIISLSADLPQNSDDTRKRDSAMVGAIKRPGSEDSNISINSFLSPIDLSHLEKNQFFYQERATPPTSSHLNLSYLNIYRPSNSEKVSSTKPWWTIVAPASLKEFKLPALPNDLSKPPALLPKEEWQWSMSLLGFNDTSFDYSNISESSLIQGITHFSLNTLTLETPAL